MYDCLIALCLIILGLTPSFGLRNELIAKLEEELVSVGGVVKEDSKMGIIPEKTLDYQGISSSSAAALFVDARSGEVLFEKNPNMRLPMASITKLMTALIVVENAKPTDIVIVPDFTTHPLDTNMGLTAGDKITVNNLLHGLLIGSGADASLALSSHVAGSEQKFVAMMNERVAKLGITTTQFTNSIGHDDNGHYSTASDIIKISRIALSNPQIAEIVAKKTYTAVSEDGKRYSLSNTNLLLGTPYYMGIKTGTTFMAGQCLASIYDDGTRNIIGVVLGSSSRFFETERIIEWTKSSYTW